MNPISIAIHGGAGTITRESMTPEMEKKYMSALEHCRNAGYEILLHGGSSLDAVATAVAHLEDCPLFNAGKGSVFSAKGNHEMDASIMDGSNLQAGAVSLIHGIANPIKLAKDVMKKSDFVFLAGEGALEFAKSLNYTFEDETYFYDEFRFQQWQKIKNTASFQLDHSLDTERKFGTVGAVAIDINGNLAAATSTGGMTNKIFGRIGDSPIIGAGTYANNQTCAVSCTGSGEYFIRGVVAYDVSCLMEYKEYDLERATNEVVMEKLVKIGGDGGLIAIDPKGNISFAFNTEGMYRAARNNQGLDMIAIYKD
jgi:beta-aspartyl-peptidase (threonine type)